MPGRSLEQASVFLANSANPRPIYMAQRSMDENGCAMACLWCLSCDAVGTGHPSRYVFHAGSGTSFDEPHERKNETSAGGVAY